jgi:localization factor PodJL
MPKARDLTPQDIDARDLDRTEPMVAAHRILPDRLPRTDAAPAVSLDLPLEPGSGRPRTEGVAAPGQDQQSIRQNLIAAARRSAKAATDAAAAAPAAAAETPKAGGRLKEIMEKRKRPILLGLAAIVLAIGTTHVVTGALKGGKTPPRPAVETPVIEPSSAALPETPAQNKQGDKPKDQTSALAPAPAATPSLAISGPVLAAATAQDVTGSTAPSGPVLTLPAAATATPEPVQQATNIGDLPAGLGGAGVRKAALSGDARAVYELAARAADGPGASRDPKLALRLFERAAVAGLTPAQFRLGNMFEKGIGTSRDIALARVWYTRAAERGNAKAMHNLAVLHAEGISGKPDYATATEWFRKAAELGVRDSQYNLAILLGRGLGAAADLGQSYLWFAVAAGQGDEDAAKKRDEVALRLTPADLATAKMSAERWRPAPLKAEANEVVPPAKGWDETPTAANKKPAKPPART